MFADFTFKIPFEERIRLIKENGFDGVMLGFSDGLKYTQYDIVRNFGLKIENVHSQFDRMNALWTISRRANISSNEHLNVSECAVRMA